MSDDQKQEISKVSATASTSDPTDPGDVLASCTSGGMVTAASTDPGCTTTNDPPKTGRTAPLDDREEQ
jgi:hypothetical protein